LRREDADVTTRGRASSAFEETDRTKQVGWSVVRRIFERISRLERAGERVIHLEIGAPDFATPEHVREAAKRALDLGETHYSSNYGIFPLRQAIARKLQTENGVAYDPDSEIIVTTGASEAIHLSMSALVSPGDEVLVPEPAWPNYRNVAVLLGATPVAVPLREARAFELDPLDVERRITSRTRLLVLVSPANPTGAVLSPETLRRLAGIAERHGLLVLSDEIYEKLIYDGREHVSVASLPGMRERTVTVNGFSKAYAMCGWRLGYLAAPEVMVTPMVKIREYMTSCVTTFAQFGGIAALEGPQAPRLAMAEEFGRRRALIVAGLREIPGIAIEPPGGAFYAFPSIRGLGRTSAEVADYLLEEAKVAVVPGPAFGEVGEGYVRISYANSAENLTEALGRMREALGKLS
jgi:aminotransferase